MGRQPSAKRPLLLLAKVAKSLKSGSLGRANEGMKKGAAVKLATATRREARQETRGAGLNLSSEAFRSGFAFISRASFDLSRLVRVIRVQRHAAELLVLAERQAT